MERTEIKYVGIETGTVKEAVVELNQRAQELWQPDQLLARPEVLMATVHEITAIRRLASEYVNAWVEQRKAAE